jgi:hypothetical protein
LLNKSVDFGALDICMLQLKAALNSSAGAEETFCVLAELFNQQVGARLISFSLLQYGDDIMARRVWTSHPNEYPVNGLKVMPGSEWTDHVIRDGKVFICRDQADVKRVLPDFKTIFDLGCGSVLNLPVILNGSVIGTVNLLNEANWFNAERVARAEVLLVLAYIPFLLSLVPSEELKTWSKHS